METYVLFESATGYALFQVNSIDEIGQNAASVQQALSQKDRFTRYVQLKAFGAFQSAANALEQINAISESQVTEDLQNFLSLNFVKTKKAKFQLGVQDPKLGSAISEALKIPVISNEFTGEILRCVRFHFSSTMDKLSEADLKQAQLGLGHSYSRAKVKFNVNKVDNMIIQAIALLDTLDKDINTFVMRVREWYGWHFPELFKIVQDQYQYCRVMLVIGDRENQAVQQAADQELAGKLTEITKDEDISKQILEAAKISIGQDISPIDLKNIEIFAKRVIQLAEYRYKLHVYLLEKMQVVAPNLSSLIGETVGARLISHAGSLTNLAKAPASTIQILGAEKALFRALKKKGNTPKYGLIFHSSFVGRAKLRNKGRISRYLANKAAIATRLDAFLDITTNAFGVKLREQVEERLKFYEEGVSTRKNVAVMQEALEKVKADNQESEPSKKKKKSLQQEDVEMGTEEKPKKKKKKSMDPVEALQQQAEEKIEVDMPSAEKKKKKKKSVDPSQAVETVVEPVVAMGTAEKKKKKKSMDAAPVLVETVGAGTGEKKKKKKSMDAGVVVEPMVVDVGSGEKPKKKKKKSLDAAAV